MPGIVKNGNSYTIGVAVPYIFGDTLYVVRGMVTLWRNRKFSTEGFWEVVEDDVLSIDSETFDSSQSQIAPNQLGTADRIELHRLMVREAEALIEAHLSGLKFK